jgi:hypothetical protein
MTASPDRRSKLHLLAEHLIGIGHVAVRAGQLETAIKTTIDRRSNYGPLPKSLKKVVMDLSQRQQLKLLEEWFSRDLPRRAAEIHKLFSGIHKALNERNEIIHGVWQPTKSKSIKNIVEMDLSIRKIKIRRSGVTAKTLHALAEMMLDLGIELADVETAAMSARFRRRGASLGISLPPS